MTTTAGIVATFNQREYALEAIAGLAEQVDEVILVDDCSTDGTWELVQSLRIPNLRSFRNPMQLGVSATYNRAVRETTSDVLLIQGGDDRSLPGRAAAQVRELDDPHVSLVYSLPIVIDATGAQLPDALASEFLMGRSDPDPLTFLFYDSNYICAPAVAVRRNDYVEVGGFRPGIDLLQDYDLWLTLSARGSFIRLEEPVVEYRKHGSNISREHGAVDAPKLRRLAAERGHVRRRFLERSSGITRSRLAVVAGLDGSTFSDLDPAGQVTILALSHPDRLVVQLGLDALFDLVGNGHESRLRALGLDHSDLARFATIADPDNLAGLSAALGAATALFTPTDRS